MFLYTEADFAIELLILGFLIAWCYIVGPVVWRTLPAKWEQRGNDLKIVFMVFAFLPASTLAFVGLAAFFSTITNHAISLLLTSMCIAGVMTWAFQKNKPQADIQQADAIRKSVIPRNAVADKSNPVSEIKINESGENAESKETNASLLAAEIMLAVNVETTFYIIKKNSAPHTVSDHDLFFSEYAIGNSWEGLRSTAQGIGLDKFNLSTDAKWELLTSAYLRAYSKLKIEPRLDSWAVSLRLKSVIKNKGDEYTRGGNDRSRYEAAKQNLLKPET